MPNDLPIPPIGQGLPVGPRAHAPAAFPAEPRPTAGLVAAGPIAAGQAMPNPTLRLDPTLGLVVIEFRDERGAVENSFPTERQLAAYRTSANTGKSEPGAPHGQAGRQADTPQDGGEPRKALSP